MLDVLVLAPHADDETLGVGGTIQRYVANGDTVHVAVVTGNGAGVHPIMDKQVFDTVQSECKRAMRHLGVHSIQFLELPAVTFPDGAKWRTNKAIGDAIAAVRPDVLFVPFPYDLHEDHRAVFHSASVAWRPSSEVGRKIRQVYCYEVQSETHWNVPSLEPGFAPNYWVGLSEDQLLGKLRALAEYRSQVFEFPHARSVEAVEHLARWRGSQQGMTAAEGLILVKGIL